MAEEYLSPEQQLTLMHIDLEIEEIVRALDETMEWEADDEDRGLVLQHLRWAYIDGYMASRFDHEASLRQAGLTEP